MSRAIVDSKIAQEVAKIFLKIKAVTFRFDPPYTYTTGLKSPIYLDNRLIISYPEIRNKIINYYLDIINSSIGPAKIDYISATATAAIPQGTLIADRLNLPMVYVRPTTKAYGKGGKVEGYLKKGSRVLVIEDQISTGNSAVNNAQSLRELGAEVEYCITTTTYEISKALELLAKNKIKLYSLTTGRIIVDTAFKKRHLSQKEKEMVDLWFENPILWEEKWQKLI